MVCKEQRSEKSMKSLQFLIQLKKLVPLTKI